MIFLYYFSLILFVLLCLVTCFSVLIQESKSMGLGATFGGESASAFFGASTADVLKKFTAILGGVFLISCLILSIWSAMMEPTKVEARPIEVEKNG
ncbi:MAG: preprotein translocase subunit SecG [Chlamydiae bacterium]|nr:preprotein translocase subunit SecG [Chlamydiota bacterium]